MSSAQTGPAAAALLQRTWAAGLLRQRGGQVAAAALALGTCAWLAQIGGASAGELGASHPAFHPVAADLNQLAEGEDFWSNVGRYGSYFFSVLLGTAYTAVRPIGGLLRKPVTAVATLAALAALAVFVTSTVSAMLGLNGGYEYEASSLLPPPRA
ncbi:hypothetical protein WJX81_003796 [Elliptochloris bilobata]|uniref:Uncharacterized protein ycf33 n=1 Tax=Elliptochloris bilobata TaxID=381761 RepID=A0AAW1QLE0_9CHLO